MLNINEDLAVARSNNHGYQIARELISTASEFGVAAMVGTWGGISARLTKKWLTPFIFAGSGGLAWYLGRRVSRTVALTLDEFYAGCYYIKHGAMDIIEEQRIKASDDIEKKTNEYEKLVASLKSQINEYVSVKSPGFSEESEMVTDPVIMEIEDPIKAEDSYEKIIDINDNKEE